MSKSMNIPLFEQISSIPETLSNEWYTQAKYIEAAREVMNGIELDPASCKRANAIVRASRHYTAQENGLKQEWKAKSLWLNPPYGSVNGKSNMATWSQHLIDQYTRGNVKQAILLCMANTEALWFAPLWEHPICFPCPRVLFHRPNGTVDHHVQGTCFVYFGPDPQKFILAFRKFGPVITPDGVHKRPEQVVSPLLIEREAAI